MVEEGEGERGLDQVADVVEERDHEEGAGRDEGRRVVEELEGVAVQLLLVGGCEDLGQGGEEDGQGGEGGTHQVDAHVVHGRDAHPDRDGNQRDKDGAWDCLAIEGTLKGDRHRDAS